MVFGWHKKTEKKVPNRPHLSFYDGLRQHVFSTTCNDIRVEPTLQRPWVWGVLMDIGHPDYVATLVSLADRTTNVYFSNSSSIINAGQHPVVAKSSWALIDKAQEFYKLTESTTNYPLPTPGKVRFYLLGFDGTKTAEADEQELGFGRHRFSPLYHIAHEVISNARIRTANAQTS